MLSDSLRVCMSSKDIEYYREQAATERGMAKAADRQNVREIHEELARQYEALVEQGELRPAFEIVSAHAA